MPKRFKVIIKIPSYQNPPNFSEGLGVGVLEIHEIELPSHLNNTDIAWSLNSHKEMCLKNWLEIEFKEMQNKDNDSN